MYILAFLTTYWDRITSDTGNLTILPGELTMMTIRAEPYFQVGTNVNVTLNAAGFAPTLNASISIPVRSAPEYELTALVANSWAYDNGTIYVEVQNTGEGYIDIDLEGLLNDIDFSIENAILTGGRLLFTSDVLGITIDADYWGVNLIAGETVTVRLNYMSDMPRYEGLNVTIPLTIQVAPTPPSPPTSPQPHNSANRTYKSSY